MKKLLLPLLFLLLAASFSQTANAQARVGYVDTEYILEQMQEYRSAQQQLDELANEWKKEIERRVTEIDRMFKAYQAEYPVLPEAERKKREDVIAAQEKALNDYKREKFGPEGELFRKRQQLIKPIQDKVFDAVQKLADDRALDIIFDKAGAATMLYTNSKYDYSNEVLDLLGVARTPTEQPGNK